MQAVDGVLTNDNDTFLYGALTVYCDLRANEKVLFTATLTYGARVMFVQVHWMTLPQEFSMSMCSMSSIQQLTGLAQLLY